MSPLMERLSAQLVILWRSSVVWRALFLPFVYTQRELVVLADGFITVLCGF